MEFERRLFGSSRPKPKPPAVRNRLLTPDDLPAKGICYHPNHLHRLVLEGKFPPPVKLSPRKIAWRESDIDAWIETKIQQPETRGRKPSKKVGA